MKISSIEDIRAWQSAREFNKQVYTFFKDFNRNYEQDLARQLFKSSGSLMDNIAEGYGRGGNKEFINFMTIALGSAWEARSQITRAHDFHMIPEVSRKELLALNDKCVNQIGALVRYLKRSPYKGTKFNENEQ